MRRTSRLFLPVAVVLAVVAAGFAAYFRDRADDLAAALTAADAVAVRDSARVDAYVRLATADSLLHRGDFGAALAAYRAIVEDSAAAVYLDGAAEVGVSHAHRVRRMAAALDTLAVLGERPRAPRPQPLLTSLPRPVAPLPLARSRPDQYDSLTFALQRAEMEIRTLEGRLKRNSGGNYLTFPSRQGNEVYYVGEVRDGKANGRGVALLSSGSRYIGEWRDNRKHGVGEFHWPDGASYEGEYVDDEREGRGTYHFPDHGGVFVGAWEDDVRNGDGVFYDDEGEVVAKGLWEDDELVERR